MSKDEYALTLSLKNKRGLVRMKYAISREELLNNEKTAALLRLHESSFPKDAPKEKPKA